MELCVACGQSFYSLLGLHDHLEDGCPELRKYQPAFPETVLEYKRYYVEYTQDYGGGANAACVIIKAKDLRHLYERLKKKDFGNDDPNHNYCISYYNEIEENFDEFIKNITKGTSTVDCIIEISKPDNNKVIIDSFRNDDVSGTIITTEIDIKNKVLVGDLLDVMNSKGTKIEVKDETKVMRKIKNMIQLFVDEYKAKIIVPSETEIKNQMLVKDVLDVMNTKGTKIEVKDSNGILFKVRRFVGL